MTMKDELYFEDKHFSESDLESLESGEFISCIFEGLNLSESSLKESKLIECQFINCNLSNVSIVGASFRDVSFSNSKLMGLNWSSVSTVYDLKFENCQLDFSVFHDVKLQNLLIQNCSCRDIDFFGCDLIKSNFSGSDLVGSHFNQCDLQKSDFTDVKNHSIDLRNNKLEEAKFDMVGAISLVELMGIRVER